MNGRVFFGQNIKLSENQTSNTSFTPEKKVKKPRNLTNVNYKMSQSKKKTRNVKMLFVAYLYTIDIRVICLKSPSSEKANLKCFLKAVS